MKKLIMMGLILFVSGAQGNEIRLWKDSNGAYVHSFDADSFNGSVSLDVTVDKDGFNDPKSPQERNRSKLAPFVTKVGGRVVFKLGGMSDRRYCLVRRGFLKNPTYNPHPAVYRTTYKATVGWKRVFIQFNDAIRRMI